MASSIGSLAVIKSEIGQLAGIGSLTSDRGEVVGRIKSGYLKLQANPLRSKTVAGPSPSNKLQSEPADMGNVSEITSHKSNQRAGLLVDNIL